MKGAGAARRGNGFSPEYFPGLAKVEAGSFWFRARSSLLVWALGYYFPDAESLLEVGCGNGFVLGTVRSSLPHLRLSGGDVFMEGLQFGRRRVPTASFTQLDARQLPFRAQFDVVGAFDVIEHIEDDRSALREIFQAIKPGGGLLLTVPQHRFLWSSLDAYSLHKRRYSARELISKTEQAGFELLRATSFVSVLLPVMLLSRLRWRRKESNLDPMSELRLHRAVDAVCEQIMAVERFFIRKGASFPAGGSLLVVAKRPESRLS